MLLLENIAFRNIREKRELLLELCIMYAKYIDLSVVIVQFDRKFLFFQNYTNLF